MLATVMLLFSFIPVADSDQWSKTFAVSGTPEFRARTSDANIRIQVWEKNAIEARVTTKNWKIGGDGIEILERQSGDLVELEVRYPHRYFSISWKNRRVDIEVFVPKAVRLNLRTGDGDADVRGLTGEVTIHTGDGNLQLEQLEGVIRATTSDGDIDVRDAKGDLTFETGDGHVRLENIEGKLHASTSDGNVKVTGRFEVMEIKTGDGRIEAKALAGSKMAADWLLRTNDGSLTLQLPDDFEADLDVKTGDGYIDLDLPVQISGRPRSNSLRGKLNAGGRVLTIKTGDGSVYLQRL